MLQRCGVTILHWPWFGVSRRQRGIPDSTTLHLGCFTTLHSSGRQSTVQLPVWAEQAGGRERRHWRGCSSLQSGRVGTVQVGRRHCGGGTSGRGMLQGQQLSSESVSPRETSVERRLRWWWPWLWARRRFWRSLVVSGNWNSCWVVDQVTWFWIVALVKRIADVQRGDWVWEDMASRMEGSSEGEEIESRLPPWWWHVCWAVITSEGMELRR